VSENIMLGQLCPLGTGAFDLLLNEAELAAAVDLLALEEDEFAGAGGGLELGMTPGRMTPSRTPHYTPNRWGAGLCVCAQFWAYECIKKC
jgi:DNA-directed RNA polymerase II subunit RPB1